MHSRIPVGQWQRTIGAHINKIHSNLENKFQYIYIKHKLYKPNADYIYHYFTFTSEWSKIQTVRTNVLQIKYLCKEVSFLNLLSLFRLLQLFIKSLLSLSIHRSEIKIHRLKF